MAEIAASAIAFHWRCKHTWRRSAYNTMWCLIGCSIGDFGAIAWFGAYWPDAPVWIWMPVAMLCGIITSIILETIILLRSMEFGDAFRTAVGMSLASMILMELAMNFTDLGMTGGPFVMWWSVPPALLAGMLAAWPYNYWRLKKYGKACH